MSRRREKRHEPTARRPVWLVPVLAAAVCLGLRLWFLLEMRGQPFSTLSPHVIDSWYYHRQALAILSGNVSPEPFFLRPLYPHLLALAYAVFGRGNVLAVQVLQALMATGSCLLLWDSCRRMFGKVAAGAAAFGFALCGILVFHAGALLYFELTVLLSLLLVWLVLVARDRWWRWLLAGICFGLLVICRPEFLLLLPAFLVILWRQNRKKRLLVVMAIATIAVAATVPVRNIIVARDPVLFTAHSGINFYYGNNPSADGTWQPAPDLAPAAGFSHEQLKRAARIVDGREVSWSRASSHWLGKGLRYLASNPGRALELVGRRFLLFWAGYEVPSNYYPETARAGSLALVFAFVGFALVAALGVVGLVLAWRERRKTWPAYLLVGMHLLSALVFYVMSRLRAPVIPFLLMFAGFTVASVVTWAKGRKYGRVAVALLVAALVFAGSSLIPAGRAGYSSQAWTQQGNILLSARRAKEAREAFARAIEVNPDNPSARYSLLMLLASAGRSREAQEQYRHITRLARQDPAFAVLAELAAARIAIMARDFPAAVASYRAALELDPHNAETWYLLGLVYVSADSLARAEQALSRALDIDPAHDAARDIIGRVRGRLGTTPR